MTTTSIRRSRILPQADFYLRNDVYLGPFQELQAVYIQSHILTQLDVFGIRLGLGI